MAPIRSGGGLVPSLNRPGENITGVSWFGVDLAPKQLAMLHELVPNANVIAFLVDENLPDAVAQVPTMQEASRNRHRAVALHEPIYEYASLYFNFGIRERW